MKHDVVGVVGAGSAAHVPLAHIVDDDAPVVAEERRHVAWADPIVRVETVRQRVRWVAGVVVHDEQCAAGGDEVDQSALGVMVGGAAKRRLLC